MITISDIRFYPCRREDRVSGLRGWATFVVDGAWILDSVAVRRARDGRGVISFPTRLDNNRVEHVLVRPVSNAVRSEVEAQVVAYVRKAGYLE